MRVCVPEGDAGGAKGGSEREGVGSARTWRERERECVCACMWVRMRLCKRERERECVCVCVCMWVRMWLRKRERERECVCVDADTGACDTRRGKTIRGAAPCELGMDKQKGMAIEVDGK